MRQILGPRMAAIVIALLVGVTATLAEAQSSVGMKLCVFSSGALTVPRSLLQSGAPDTPVQVPVAFYAVMHLKGNVLFDTGNNDRIITEPSYWGPANQRLNPVRTPDVAIEGQLSALPEGTR